MTDRQDKTAATIWSALTVQLAFAATLACGIANAQASRHEVLTVPAQQAGGVPRPGLWEEYTLYSPAPGVVVDETTPILFFLHGAGRRGTDPAQVQSLPPVSKAINGEDFPFYIAAPQARPGRSWSEAVVLDELEAFIDDVVALTDADPNRIYLAGQSMGGRGVWELLLSRPEQYAAAIPIAGDVSRKGRVTRLVDVPIWAFHGRNDNTVPVEGSIEIVDRITEAGGEQAKLTIYEDGGHSVWWRAFNQEPELYDWMLAQSTRSVPEPSTTSLAAVFLAGIASLFPRRTTASACRSLPRGAVAGVAAISALFLAAPTTAATPEAISQFNTVVGTQTIGPAYGFTSESRLYETATRMREMGSNTLKISLTGNAYADINGAPTDLSQLVQWGDFKRVLDMDFAHYHFWAYSPLPQAWSFGAYEQFEQDLDYQTIYNLTTQLLTTYSGTGKTFYIGNWEGDWHLVGQGNPNANPSQQKVDQMAQWYNVRQSAIEDAKSDLAGQITDVDVFQYAEVNLVRKAIADTDPNDEVRTLTNDVLPQTSIDYVSYSSWDSLNSLDLEVVDAQLIEAFNHIEAQLQPKSGLPTEKRVFLGEYGWRLPRVGTAEEQERYSRDVALTALEWGAPFALYWEFYDNSLNNGENLGFWLIDDQDEKQPLYHTFANYYEASESFLTGFSETHGRMPTEAEFRAFGVEALAAVASAVQSTAPGDFNGDGMVDAADYTLWRDDAATDFGSDGYYVWRGDFGEGVAASGDGSSIPEPDTILLLIAGVLGLSRRRVAQP